MSGICSAHRSASPLDHPECPLCQVNLRDDPRFMAKVAEAEAAGVHHCICGFDYYKTTDSCPACNTKR